MSDRYGLIGKNISYSKSPTLHKFMAKKLGLDIDYVLLDVEASEIKDLMKQMKMGAYQGFNVTIPHKEIVMNYVDVLTPKASRIRAVNTIYMKNGKIVGDNTDYDGFLESLRRNRIQVENKKVYLLGTGGAAKAAYVVLSDLGAKITVVSRRSQGVDPLFQKVIAYKNLDPFDVDIYVQATPIGGPNHLGESILSKVYVQGKTVIDLVYDPFETEMMKYAKFAVGGVYMMIVQAIKAEEIYWNKKIEITDMLVSEIIFEVFK